MPIAISGPSTSGTTIAVPSPSTSGASRNTSGSGTGVPSAGAVLLRAPHERGPGAGMVAVGATHAAARERSLEMDDPAGAVEADRAAATGGFGLERLNALTDGVFAIVLTLLVLELKLPEPDADETVLQLLRENVHVLVAWAISFLAIARFWIVHHLLTGRMVRCVPRTLALNLGVLGLVTLMPFTADAIGTNDIAEPWSTVVFAGNIGLVSLALGLLARHVVATPGLLVHDRAAAELAFHRAHHLYRLPLVTAGAGVLAFVEPYLAVVLLLVEFVAIAWITITRR